MWVGGGGLQKNHVPLRELQSSWCSVGICVLPKVVILLHVLYVGRGELSEVLGATIVHAVW